MDKENNDIPEDELLKLARKALEEKEDLKDGNRILREQDWKCYNCKKELCGENHMGVSCVVRNKMTNKIVKLICKSCDSSKDLSANEFISGSSLSDIFKDNNIR